jgi:hypothetical protein
MIEIPVTVIDPWSFVDEHGSNLRAVVRAADGDSLLLELAGGLYVATPGGDYSWSLIPTTADHAHESPLWVRDLWRGQPAALLANLQV